MTKAFENKLMVSKVQKVLETLDNKNNKHNGSEDAARSLDTGFSDN